VSPPSPGWIRRLGPFLAAHRRDVVVAFAAALVGQGIAALVPLLQKQVVDGPIVHRHHALAPLLGALLAVGAFSFGAAYVRRYVGGRVSLDVQYDLRNTIYDHLQVLDFARHDDLQTGQLVSRANSDVNLVQGLLAFLPVQSGNLLKVVVSLVIMSTLSLPLTLVSLCIVPMIFAAALRMRSTVYPATWDSQQRIGELAGVVDEAVSGVRVVKGFGQEQRELDRLIGSGERLYASRLRALKVTTRYVAALQSIPTLGQVAFLFVGGWLALHGRISIGTFLAFFTYLVQMVAPARMFAGMLTIAQQARAGAERIFELLDSVPLVSEREDAVVLAPVTGEVEFEHVTFGYLRSDPVLRDFSLRLAPGETVAIVGASGSGKSTVSLLLPRFYDVHEGHVRLDGVDVRDVTFDSLRRQVGVVFEESFLFSDTIAANIAFGRPDATRAQIETAARAAEAHDFIAVLPLGYDTVVGERGLTLSGGQRQRIALARALLTEPQVLLLDDATSSVDARTEEEIHATLRRLMEGRTTLLIAHRRSTLRLARRIVVVEHGRVVDDGTHEELLARCRLYRSLLAGPGDDVEGEGDEDVPDGTEIEAEAAITTAAWAAGDRDGPRARVALEAPAPVPGGGMFSRPGAGFAGGMLASGPATPELIAALAKLPPADEEPHVDVAREAQPDPNFKLRTFLRPYRGRLAVGLGLVATDVVLTLLGPLLVQRGVDHGIAHKSLAVIQIAALVFFVVTIADWAVTWWENVQTGRTAERLLFALRVRIFAHLQRLALDFYDREMAGRIMTRMTSDVEALSNLLQNGLINAAVNVGQFAGMAVVLLVLQPRLALVTLSVAPPMIWATAAFRRGSERAYGRARDRIAAVNANLQESLSGVRVTQAFRREERNMTEFRRVAGEHLEARMDAQRLQSLYFPFVEFVSVVATAMVLWAGTPLVHSHALSIGKLVAFILYLNLFFAPIQQLSQVFDTYQQARAALDKIEGLVAEPTSTPEIVDPVRPTRLRGEVVFEDVHFRYPNAPTDALTGVDLRVAPGETVALVGETGAGKSTIVKLVARFYDATHGRVLVDGIDVRDYSLSAYRQRLGYVPQEAFLFSGTIADNIAYGRPSASEPEIEAAARAVGAHDFIAGLTGGYLHPVTERGRSLSGGQRQLIALARAQLVDPAVLLLDEATSNLDLATEARVNAAMGVVAAGRTTLLIAHRLQTAARADRILVVQDGHVVEDGSHAALLAARGRYSRMWAAFAVDDLPA